MRFCRSSRTLASTLDSSRVYRACVDADGNIAKIMTESPAQFLLEKGTSAQDKCRADVKKKNTEKENGICLKIFDKILKNLKKLLKNY